MYALKNSLEIYLFAVNHKDPLWYASARLFLWKRKTLKIYYAPTYKISIAKNVNLNPI